MKVLVACEYSGRVRDAFIAAGHDAMSCDLLPSEATGPHYVGDVFDVIGDGWDLMIAHPPCTYLCSMGVWWNKKRPERWPLTHAAADFVRRLYHSSIPQIAIENPVGWLSTNWQRPAQIIHPWQFGHEANKPTCLWLKNLAPLFPTRIVSKGQFYTKANGQRMSKWSHVTSGTSEDRWRIASRTFSGIADAMANQWGSA
jgi:hypothetical protein